MGSVGRNVGVLAALIGVVLLGNMRSAASETTAQGAPAVASGAAAAALGTVSTDPVAAIGAVLRDEMLAAGNGDPEDVASGAPDASDDGRLIPAIYAWDPDVRFVYFRHVHKWM